MSVFFFFSPSLLYKHSLHTCKLRFYKSFKLWPPPSWASCPLTRAGVRLRGGWLFLQLPSSRSAEDLPFSSGVFLPPPPLPVPTFPFLAIIPAGVGKKCSEEEQSSHWTMIPKVWQAQQKSFWSSLLSVWLTEWSQEAWTGFFGALLNHP